MTLNLILILFITAMPYRCCVPGCGCKGSLGEAKVALFKFPKDPEVFAQWIARIPRENLVARESTRICSLHFTPDSFVTNSQDTTVRRKKRRPNTELVRKYLKPNAVPTVFFDYNVVSFEECLEQAAAAAALYEPMDDDILPQSDDYHLKQLSDTREDKSDLHYLEELYIRLSEAALHDDICLVRKADQLICLSMPALPNGQPVINYSLTIWSDFSFLMFGKNGLHIKAGDVKHLTKKGRESSVSIVLKLLEYLHRKVQFGDTEMIE